MQLTQHIISCGRNETWSHDSTRLLLVLDTCLAAFLQLTEHDFGICGLSYKVFCLTHVTVGVRGNVVLLSRPSNCK